AGLGEEFAVLVSGSFADDDDAIPVVLYAEFHLFPEVPFNRAAFLKRVKFCVQNYGYCVIVVSEGAAYKNGKFLAEAGTRDAFGHAQLGGVAPVVAGMVRDNLGYKYHYAVADYLQRSARHIASAVDVKQAYAVGKSAVEFALKGHTAVMPVIKRKSDKPYRWTIEKAPLSRVANQEKMMPKKFITKDGFGITEACRRYLAPLIKGEDYPPYVNGLPKVATLKGVSVKPKLKTKFVV
ncbi:MAG: diphosphate--fructose-6-phosphate 1-phosphotransferase, partial [Pseudomonadota bacterium]